MTPLWLQRLPHNLSTIRAFFAWKIDVLDWGLYAGPRLRLNRGDKDYLFHYEKGPLLAIDLGPVHFAVGLKDTPEENAWIK